MPFCDNPECGASLGIHEGPTFGSGQLDDNGYWEIPCYTCAREWDSANPNAECPAWPFPGQQ